MISKEDQTLINFLNNAGYGWGEFTSSVEKQGWVSDRQRSTMQNMKAKILHHRKTQIVRNISISMEPHWGMS